jgi:hypothetical protein
MTNPDIPYNDQIHSALSGNQQVDHLMAYDLAWEADLAFDTMQRAAMNVHGALTARQANPTIATAMDMQEAETNFHKRVYEFELYKKAAEVLMPPIAAYTPIGQEPAPQAEWRLVGDEFIIEELDLGVRVSNHLKRAGINTVDQLVTKSEAELRKLPNLGQEGINEIKDALFSKRAYLRPEDMPAPVLTERGLKKKVSLSYKDVESLLKLKSTRDREAAESSDGSSSNRVAAVSLSKEEQILNYSIERLTPSEKVVLRGLFGLEGEEKITQKSLAEHIEVSPTTLAHIKYKTLLKLTKLMENILSTQEDAS